MGSPADTHRAIALLAARQDGHLHRQQLLDCGLTRRQVVARAERGWFIERHTDVFAIGHVPRTRDATFRAAVLAFSDAVLSYRAAGAKYEVVRGAVPVEVTVSPLTGLARRDGIVVHRQHVPDAHRRTREGLPITSLVRTILDLAAVLPPRRLAGVFEEAQVAHHLDPSVLGAEVISRPGHRGTGRLRVLLEDAVDPDGVRSILELRFLRLCAQHGLPRPLVNEQLGPWMPDFFWPAAGVVVETDGYAFHRTAAKRRAAARKDAYLRSLGLEVIRLTWADVVERPLATARRVLGALSVSHSPV